MPEMWILERSRRLAALAPIARRLESDGWDGICLVDSQNMAPEPYTALAAIATATKRLGLGIAVTNPVTRHPTVAAAAAVTLQRISEGRLNVAIGRGDSAAAHIGLAPLGVAGFEDYVDALRRLLNGAAIEMSRAARFAGSDVKPISTLNLHGEPEMSRLKWAVPEDVPVPLEIAGSGPKVLSVGARLGDRTMLAVGAAPERVAWAVEVVRAARREAGLPADMPIGAYVSVAANDDPDIARLHIRGTLAGSSRFSVMHGRVNGPTSDASEAVLKQLHAAYDMNYHGQDASNHSQVLDDAFIDEFGIAGTGEECAGRLRQLAELGLDKFVIFNLPEGTPEDVMEDHRRLMAAKVLPAVKQE